MENYEEQTDWTGQIRAQPLSQTDRTRERVPAPVIGTPQWWWPTVDHRISVSEGYYKKSQTNESLYPLKPNKARFKQSQTPRRSQKKWLSEPAFPTRAYVCVKVSKGLSSSTRSGTLNPVTMPEGELKDTHLPPSSSPPALSSSWPFSFLCLASDNGGLSVTQGLT